MTELAGGDRGIRDDEDVDWESENASTSTNRGVQPSTSSSRPSNRHRMRSFNSFTSSSATVISSGASSSASTENKSKPKQSDIYNRFISRYRNKQSNGSDAGFYRGLGQLMDERDSDEENDSPSTLANGSADRASALLLAADPLKPETVEDKERIDWQVMLESVLRGDVLNSEKSRIAQNTFVEQSSGYQEIWLGIRAKLHCISPEEERKRLDDQRLRFVDSVIEELSVFRIPDETTDAESALKLVNALLCRIDAAQDLYPTLKAFHLDKPATLEASFQNRYDTLSTWSAVLTSLIHHVRMLQRWTGSDTLDITKPNTNPEMPIPGHAVAGHPDVADASTFVERVLKENSLQHTFERGALDKVHSIISSARDAIVNLAVSLSAMNLPTFEKQLIPLISFPTKLVQASLVLRLNYVKKLKDPEILIIDQMTEDLKLSIGLACTLKQQHDAFLEPDQAGKWNIPSCISEDYDSTILQALAIYCRLIHLKLKSVSKSVYYKETDVLEAHWATFNDVSLIVPRGSVVVAEQICSLTNKLIFRVTNYFESQVRTHTQEMAFSTERQQSFDSVPVGIANGSAFQHHLDSQLPSTSKMTEPQLVDWYEKILENIRMRYRKLQRFARTLASRFNNSAEYDIENVPVKNIISTLVAADHFLVFTRTFEEDGTYIIAPKTMYNRPNDIRRMLEESFHVTETMTEDGLKIINSMHNDEEYEYDEAQYILVLSPRSKFIWNGLVLIVEIPLIDLDLRDNRVRIIANGPQRRLELAKQDFARVFELSEDPDYYEEIFGPDNCLIAQQAHLPTVNRLLRRINNSCDKLAESVVDSVHHVSASLNKSKDFRELLANWYLFASEYGRHAQKNMEPEARSRFDDKLIGLAIAWDSFICDDCDPMDLKTFRWATAALEFTLERTKRYNILQLNDEQFELLRQKVATCMTLFISHFDILGARSTQEAQKEHEAKKEKLRVASKAPRDALFLDSEVVGDQTHTSPYTFTDPSHRAFWDRVTTALNTLDIERAVISSQQRLQGRVLDYGKAEDRSLSFLASLSSNISVKWQQQKFIGAGAFGSVYLAVNLDSGSFMAVKEVRFQELSNVPNMHKTITEELRVMEMLHHPNVVEYYGIEVHRDRVYIFEEYCSGGSLASLLEHGRIEDEQAIQMYTISMLEGLAYLHSEGIVHRDIKPDNILLDHRGVIKYADFGAAKILTKGQTLHKSRRPSDATTGMGIGLNNSMTGTPMYMSPEVIKNDQRGRPGAMDVWSVGCIVLEFATGKKPWSNLDNEWAIMFHIGVATQHPALPEPDQLSATGINFIKQCLILDPMQRPTALELLEHPWMVEFRTAILGYEQEEELEAEMQEIGTIPASVARQAANARAEEIEAITAISPSPPPDSELDENL